MDATSPAASSLEVSSLNASMARRSRQKKQRARPMQRPGLATFRAALRAKASAVQQEIPPSSKRLRIALATLQCSSKECGTAVAHCGCKPPLGHKTTATARTGQEAPAHGAHATYVRQRQQGPGSAARPSQRSPAPCAA
eukprot:CAMPEP_0180553250 /NCGR_PEP_ID=MMETSP1036_2-20121128/74202_1 /TAXON_ID=632150 /ORGANISM="Azadinium spinosum, Strain 3D9" /LENGTH=138 /DNA_ID=CAMNT_0022568805 /DNA_START=130 /DNA_END=544 /DNA_ORIENTATION=-